MYYLGEGVPKVYTEAMKLLKKTADKGAADSMKGVSEMYKKGLGVNKDKKLAAKLQTKHKAAKAKQ